MMSTRVQTWEFKGGYKKRYIDLSLDQAGNLTQSQRAEDIKKPDNAADPSEHLAGSSPACVTLGA